MDLDVGLERLDALIAEEMSARQVPGVAVGLVLDGAEWYLSYGVTSVDDPLTVDPDTLFQIGSTTKTLTATVVMRLVEQGRLDLDEPVRTYVPELRLADDAALATVTLRHLLTHVAGHDGDLFDDFGNGDDALSRSCAAMHVLPQLAPVGAVWSYSNAGFSIAGRAIETVTGTSYEQACRDLALDPLGMTRSYFRPEDIVGRRVAVGHRVGTDGPTVTRPWALPRVVNPAGGLTSTARDQMRYALFHLGDGTVPGGERLLDSTSLKLMQSPLVEAGGGRAASVGLAWLLQPTPGLIAHGGETNGQSSSFVIVPDRQFAMTVLTNADAGVFVHTKAVKWAIRELVGLTAPKPHTEPAPATLYDEVVGRYRSLMEVFVVERSGDAIAIRFEPTPAHLAAFPDAQPTASAAAQLFADGGVRVVDGPLAGARGEFLRDESGHLTWLRIAGRVHVRDDNSKEES